MEGRRLQQAQMLLLAEIIVKGIGRREHKEDAKFAEGICTEATELKQCDSLLYERHEGDFISRIHSIMPSSRASD
jgi:hypothetical protein